ncbi:MAG: AtpZ/AtpI family protein [Candidatus Peribacteraceae bacterium]|nr:AtpZ/AtpI family protein [Candidatus Peribacteraceae bacterium]
MSPDAPPPPEKETKADWKAAWLALQLAWDLGWIIALPAAAFGFGGAYLDKYLGTSPLFLLLGFALAITLSYLGVRRKLKAIMKKRF